MSAVVSRSDFLRGVAATAGAFALGCEHLQFQGTVTSWKSDGKTTEVKTRKSESWDEFTEDVNEAVGELGETTKELAGKLKDIVDIPPPGSIKLPDLNPELKAFEGKKADFIKQAKSEDGDKHAFDYVQIGMPAYDQFFRATAEMYGILYQTKKTIASIRKLAAEADVDDDVKLDKAVKKTKKKASGAAKADINLFAKVGALLVTNAIAFAGKVAELISAGTQLIAGAVANIVHPKVVLHIDLIVKGLEQSVSFLKNSAEMIGEVAGEIKALA